MRLPLNYAHAANLAATLVGYAILYGLALVVASCVGFSIAILGAIYIAV